MKVAGFITEYNPFHFGHKYHLEQSLKLTNASHSIAIMSSSFVQRGEPSLVDKWTKANMAVANGVDLVIELPFVFSTQTAELFAYGAVKILDSLNLVDSLVFGTESGEIKDLELLAKIILEEPKLYKDNLLKNLSKGFSFPTARSKALEVFLQNEVEVHKILKGSNNILGIEYIKAISRLKSKIKPMGIKRLGSNYNELNINQQFPSATGIRNEILINGLDSVQKVLPKESYEILEEYYKKHRAFNSLENYNEIIKYLLIMKDKESLTNIFDVNDGLENRFLNLGLSTSNMNDMIDKISTKRYPKTRIQRILIHMLNDLNKTTIDDIYDSEISYIRVLAANRRGLEILNQIKSQSNIKIITKFANYKKHKDININKFLQIEEKATDMFYYGLNPTKPLVGMDYLKSPIIL